MEQEAWKHGVDPESEIVQQIDRELNDIHNRYRTIEREIYDIEKNNGFYRETGSIGELDYDIVVAGEDAEDYGARLTKEYLEDTLSLFYGENYDEEEIYGGETMTASPKSQPGSFNDYSEAGI